MSQAVMQAICQLWSHSVYTGWARFERPGCRNGVGPRRLAWQSCLCRGVRTPRRGCTVLNGW